MSVDMLLRRGEKQYHTSKTNAQRLQTTQKEQCIMYGWASAAN